MKVELSIKDDRELRNMIKDLIRSQIKSVAREEIIDVLSELVERDGTKQSLLDIAKSEVRSSARSAVHSALGGMRMDTTIKAMVRDYIAENVNLTLKK